MNNKELTPTIAEMSEVVAKYMGWENHRNYDKCYFFDGENIINFHSWKRLHEVWEKVKKEIIYIREADEYYLECSYQISEGTPIETLTALYDAIIFIQQLKQENANNANKDI